MPPVQPLPGMTLASHGLLPPTLLQLGLPEARRTHGAPWRSLRPTLRALPPPPQALARPARLAPRPRQIASSVQCAGRALREATSESTPSGTVWNAADSHGSAGMGGVWPGIPLGMGSVLLADLRTLTIMPQASGGQRVPRGAADHLTLPRGERPPLSHFGQNLPRCAGPPPPRSRQLPASRAPLLATRTATSRLQHAVALSVRPRMSRACFISY